MKVSMKDISINVTFLSRLFNSYLHLQLHQHGRLTKPFAGATLLSFEVEF